MYETNNSADVHTNFVHHIASASCHRRQAVYQHVLRSTTVQSWISWTTCDQSVGRQTALGVSMCGEAGTIAQHISKLLPSIVTPTAIMLLVFRNPATILSIPAANDIQSRRFQHPFCAFLDTQEGSFLEASRLPHGSACLDVTATHVATHKATSVCCIQCSACRVC